MKRYLPSKKARVVIRDLLIAVVMVAGAAQSLPTWAHFEGLDAVYEQKAGGARGATSKRQ